MHWIGVFYHEGFGVGKDLDKAIEYLTKAAEMGNC
jgi:TPR repeat protein